MDRSIRSIIDSLRRDGFEQCRAFLSEVYDDLKHDASFLALFVDVHFDHGEYRLLLENAEVRALLHEEVMVKVLRSCRLLKEYDLMLAEARSCQQRIQGAAGFSRLRAEIEQSLQMMQEYEGAESQETQARVDRLVAWLLEGGALLNKVTVCQFSHNYRGIRLTAATDVAEDLLLVPRRLIITYQQAFDCEALQAVREAQLLGQLK